MLPSALSPAPAGCSRVVFLPLGPFPDFRNQLRVLPSLMTSDRCRGIVRLSAADLGKAHGAEVQPELLLSLSSVHQAQIQHREPGSRLTSVLDHRLPPLSI